MPPGVTPTLAGLAMIGGCVGAGLGAGSAVPLALGATAGSGVGTDGAALGLLSAEGDGDEGSAVGAGCARTPKSPLAANATKAATAANVAPKRRNQTS
ncbi:MAG: hypothetical protein M3R44_01555 [Candidatus Eremiobacteraeota bacterium]|nr:hypothetical protein [Candidatus Eremiobacteraeota bacterium]